MVTAKSINHSLGGAGTYTSLKPCGKRKHSTSTTQLGWFLDPSENHRIFHLITTQAGWWLEAPTIGARWTSLQSVLDLQDGPLGRGWTHITSGRIERAPVVHRARSTVAHRPEQRSEGGAGWMQLPSVLGASDFGGDSAKRLPVASNFSFGRLDCSTSLAWQGVAHGYLVVSSAFFAPMKKPSNRPRKLRYGPLLVMLRDCHTSHKQSLVSLNPKP